MPMWVNFGCSLTSQAVQWDFRTSSTGNFIMNDVGDSAEMTVLRNGNVIIKGNVVANGISLTSSRSAKTDFSKIKPSEVMQKLAKMNVEEWRYKEADKNDRHISPMAEDFYKLFKLGPDNKGINPNDLASVAIIAAKELQKKAAITATKTATLKSENISLKQKLEQSTVAFKASNDSLKKQLVEQQKRLASLEKLVTSLASASDNLSHSGEKVATIK